MVAPLPVRNFDNSSELLSNYAAINKRLWSPPTAPEKKQERPAKRRSFWITTTLIAQMRELRAAGGSYSDIAKTCGCDRTTVGRYVNDVPPPPCGFKIGRSPVTLPKEAMLKRFHGGFTYAEIDRHFKLKNGVSWKAINRYLRERARPCGPIDRILRTVTAATGIGWIQIGRVAARSTKGTERLGRARHILFWLIRRDLPKVSYLTMARELGGFDHSSCLYGVKRVAHVVEALGFDPTLPALEIARLLWKTDWARKA